MKKSYGIAILVVLAGIMIGLSYRAQQKKKALEQFAVLQSEVVTQGTELVQLYEKRRLLLVQWEKSLRGGAHSTNKGAPDLVLPEEMRAPKRDWAKAYSDQEGFEAFDRFQNQITEFFSRYLGSELAQKSRPKELEKLEESINRIRAGYHQKAFQANDLIERYLNDQKPLPVLPAEKEIHRMQARP
jgi:hypothetical protein